MTDETAPARRPSAVSRVLKLGGKTLELKFDFSAVSILEDMYDQPISELGEYFQKNAAKLRVRDVVRVVYAGLKWQDATLTEDKVISMLDEAIQKEGLTVSGILAEAFEAFDASAGADPEDEDDREDAEPGEPMAG